MTSDSDPPLATPLPPDRGPPPPDLVLDLPPHPASQREARHGLQRWLVEHGWPVDPADDLVLAVSEAVANVVDHAYPPDAPGQIHLHAVIAPTTLTAAAAIDGRREWQTIISVIDRGRWRVPDAARSAAGRAGTDCG